MCFVERDLSLPIIDSLSVCRISHANSSNRPLRSNSIEPVEKLEIIASRGFFLDHWFKCKKTHCVVSVSSFEKVTSPINLTKPFTNWLNGGTNQNVLDLWKWKKV